MTPIQAVLLDDEVEFRRLAGRLTKAGLPCEALDPGDASLAVRADLVRRLIAARYSLVLIDYRLDGAAANLRAGSVSAEIREKRPDIPIVLITSEKNRLEFVSHNPVVREAFDKVLLKSSLNSPHDIGVAAGELRDLANGYLAIKKACSGKGITMKRLENLVGAKRNEQEILETVLAGICWKTVGEIAKWLLNQFLSFPGPLLSDTEAAALIGIRLDIFRGERLQTLFADARYNGPFASSRRRWWRGRLVEFLNSLVPDDWDGQRASRRKALRVSAQLRSLAPATCSWCGADKTDRVCESCGGAVEQMHYVQATIDQRPRWALAPVYCFSCIEQKDLDEVHFAPSGASLVEAIRNGNVRRPG